MSEWHHIRILLLILELESKIPSYSKFEQHQANILWSMQLSLISIHNFRLSLTLFFVKEKYIGRKINLHFLRVAAKTCRKRKLVWSSIILVLRIYWGLSSLRPDKTVGRPFCKTFLILLKCPRDSTKKSDWFRCTKISQKLKYLNFKCEQSWRYFFVLFYSFHHFAHVPFAKFRWRGRVEIRL